MEPVAVLAIAAAIGILANIVFSALKKSLEKKPADIEVRFQGKKIARFHPQSRADLSRLINDVIRDKKLTR